MPPKPRMTVPLQLVSAFIRLYPNTVKEFLLNLQQTPYGVAVIRNNIAMEAKLNVEYFEKDIVMISDKDEIIQIALRKNLGREKTCTSPNT